MYWISDERGEKKKLRKRIFLFLNYLKENPGSGFIILFMILLMSCAFLLIGKDEKAAGRVANWAYLFLVIGVIIKFIEMRKSK